MPLLNRIVLLFAVLASGGLDARLTREVYIWQRQQTDDVFAAVASVQENSDGFAFLAAEVSWRGRRADLVRVPLDFRRLAHLGRPVTLVLRLGLYTGSFGANDDVATLLCTLAEQVLRDAQGAGLEATELQVDFDCATAKLDGYREWLIALRSATKATKLTFTALPDWLRSADFPALARSADGYVLQVHSLEKPRRPDERFDLCDPVRAWRWIETAEEVGVSFRVALPTYGYRLGFDAQGRFLTLAAEGEAPDWPAGTVFRTTRSDAVAMAGLSRKIESAEMRHCSGVIWFRLPVVRDRLNWSLTTLQAVLRGEVPRTQLDVEFAWIEPGLAELRLCNRGERDEILPETVRAQWESPDIPTALDGLGGYAVATAAHSGGNVLLRASAALAERRLPPGGSRKIGWLRFSHELPLELTIASPP